MPNKQIHRNITFQRLVLDAIQFIRCQRIAVHRFGKPFQISDRFIEIDMTYRCNLKCLNCNRSCTQRPSSMEISVAAIETFIEQSIARKVKWQRIRLLGGEPTLHRRFFAIIDILRAYRSAFRPDMRIVVCTNGSGRKVKRQIGRLPADIQVKNTFKQGKQRLFRPFNLAPSDSPVFRFSDYSCGCRILADCGIGLTPMGYYACAVAGGIDRIFDFGIGYPMLPAPVDRLSKQLKYVCRYCGHFGFRWPTKKAQTSPSWQYAYSAHGRSNRLNQAAAKRITAHKSRDRQRR